MGVGAGKFHGFAIHAFVNVQRVAGLEPGAGDGGVDGLERFVGRAGILVVGRRVFLRDVILAGDRERPPHTTGLSATETVHSS